MNRQIITRPPWFVSMPAIVAAAIILAVAGNIFAGVYFERTSLDDIDPFAAFAAAPGPAAPDVPAPVVPSTAAVAPPTATSPESASPPVVEAPSGPMLLSEGTFVDGDPGHQGEGAARLIRDADGSHILRLEDFSVTNGPDLFVILSTDPDGSRSSAAAGDALNLGRLRATDGNINYAVPDGTDLANVRSVIIYCRAFRVVFAVAMLEAR
ncbi:MAG: DM13 domain-containing protein [Dehalococcoidia bacterium]